MPKKINYMVIHSTGRGKIYWQAAKLGRWTSLEGYYLVDKKVDYLITPSSTTQISKPGAEWSQAVSSRYLSDQVHISEKNKAAWLEQVKLLNLPKPRSPKDWPSYTCREVIKSWDIYADGHIPNAPDVMHVEIAPEPGKPLDKGFDYAVSRVVDLWALLADYPAVYTHSVLEPKTRIRNGLAWDPPSTFLHDVIQKMAASFPEPAPPTLEQRVANLEKKVTRMSNKLSTL